jgi:hypothetical protein
MPLGASRTRQDTHPPDNANALADIVLTDAGGGDVRLGDLWADRPAVLVWLRHYG